MRLHRRTPQLSGRGNYGNLTPWQTNTVAAVRCSALFGEPLPRYSVRQNLHQRRRLRILLGPIVKGNSEKSPGPYGAH